MPESPETGLVREAGAESPRAAGKRLLSLMGLIALVCTAALGLAVGLRGWTSVEPSRVRALAMRPRARQHTDHAGTMKGPFADGPSVTRACLACHPAAAAEVALTQHYTWLGEPALVPGQGPLHVEPVRIGKRNLLNNFCLSVESNWPRCTSCHAGYGFKDASYDFTKPELVDCLVCHDQTGTYKKGLGGLPERDVDLAAVASSVGAPTRRNCGNCHFAGGGGDAVKHGDMDASFNFPREHTDVHMGRLKFQCTACHRTSHHRISGRSMSVSVGGTERVSCTDCHSPAPHRTERLNQHARPIACVTCHVPLMALDAPTKMVWDWSTAGRDVAVEDPHQYLKQKGSFAYAKQVVPEYYWYDGTVCRYLKGDRLDPDRVLDLNPPRGKLGGPRAQIWPFKVHRGKQPYDKEYRYLLVARTWGEGGYWNTYDWDGALRLGSRDAGLAYSGKFGFVATRMYWPLSHMVQPGSRALACPDCHGVRGRMDWKRLGYDGDPANSASGRSEARP
jgi:octaheme c-type cytochrome (tetrathionate reductase family)